MPAIPSWLVSFGVAFLTVLVVLSILEALKRRGVDPVGRIADIANPRTTASTTSGTAST